MARFLTRLIEMQNGWARPLGDFNRRWLSAIYDRIGPLKDLAHGRWLGHPLHAATTDIPIGALTATVVLDLLNYRAAADVTLVIGVVFLVLSAISGAADYTDTDGTALVRATVHSTLMVVALLIYLVSIVVRSGNPDDRTFAVASSIVGYLVLTAGAYVGGDVVYVLGNMVDRHAFGGRGTKWQPLNLGDISTLPDGQPVRATAGANKILLVRNGETIHAMHEVCAHAGGPLAEGRIVDGCIECPWHGSRFRLTDATVQHGPSVYDQPRYEVRATPTGYEARRIPN
jgi:nitrite reductase/ring-hydroxylating ferredoxin subunit